MSRCCFLLMTIALGWIAGCGSSRNQDETSEASPLSESAFAGSTPVESADAGVDPSAKDDALAAERSKFLGSWTGTYRDTSDAMRIEAGDEPTQVRVTLHTSYDNPSVVTGTLATATMIDIPVQAIDGAPGQAVLVLAEDKLTLKQSALGITLEGSYEKAAAE